MSTQNSFGIMKYFGLFCLIAVMVDSTSIPSSKVCYGELGCFSIASPFTSLRRPFPRLPWAPNKLKTEFWLFTKVKGTRQSLNYADKQSILHSSFSASKKTKIIIHGFISEGKSKWVLDLKDAILSVDNVNVIVVDWRKGANSNVIDYIQACANTRVVGAQIAQLIKIIKSTTGASTIDFHIIGHSLGAHVAGYAGERITNLGRITGLDPAKPYFEKTNHNVRLDPTDANYVDVIHTDGKGFGMEDPVGHVDFYPNGGKYQPGCLGNKVTPGKLWQFTCSHARACTLMIDSIINAHSPMYGHLCRDYKTYKTGACHACPPNGCPTLGYYSDRVGNSDRVNVKYYLTTGSKPPYAHLK